MGGLLDTGRKMRCSRCGIIDAKHAWESKRGPLCGRIIEYDRMTGTKYCRRKLKPIPDEKEFNKTL